MKELDDLLVEIQDNNLEENLLRFFVHSDSGEFLSPLLTTTLYEHENGLARIKKIKEGKKSEMPQPMKIAFLDTGVLLNHPLFKPYIVDIVDFTGEGCNDENGHGSMVTWVFLSNLDVGFDPEIYICKILDKSGRGSAKSIIRGFEWAINKKVSSINISAGIERKKWFLFDCKGDCEVCKAAQKASDAGIWVAAAAGNHGITVCPAKAGLYIENSKIMSVAATNMTTSERESWSGDGNTMELGTVYVNPVNFDASTDEIAATYEAQALNSCRLGHFKEGVEGFLKALELSNVNQAFTAEQNEGVKIHLFHAFKSLLSELFREGKFAEILEWRQLVSEKMHLSEDNSLQLLLAKSYMRVNDFAGAMEYYHKIDLILGKTVGDIPLSEQVEALYEMTIIGLNMKRLEWSIEKGIQGLKLLELNYVEHSILYGHLLFMLGACYQVLDNVSYAKKYFDDSIQAYEKMGFFQEANKVKEYVVSNIANS